jgi:hypothetical protein
MPLTFGVGAPRNDLGSGLVDPVKALSKVGPKQAQHNLGSISR